jgi:hypothetical protein
MIAKPIETGDHEISPIINPAAVDDSIPTISAPFLALYANAMTAIAPIRTIVTGDTNISATISSLTSFSARLLISVLSLSALQLGLGGDTPPKQ